ncbi:MAG: acyl-CoA thioesterase [Lacibacter sp.]|jgi:acyl-CoA thioesterase FadM
MARIRLTLPETFPFSTQLQVRITDINYGNHAGNDAILGMLHEVRMRFLNSHGYTELNCGGTGLIMSDVAIEFKKELFYGDVITARVAATEWSAFGFELYYVLEKEEDGRPAVAVKAKTGMLCYDYNAKKLVPVPTEVRHCLSGITAV